MAPSPLRSPLSYLLRARCFKHMTIFQQLRKRAIINDIINAILIRELPRESVSNLLQDGELVSSYQESAWSQSPRGLLPPNVTTLPQSLRAMK